MSESLPQSNGTASTGLKYRKSEAYEDDSCESFTSYSDEFLQFSPSMWVDESIMIYISLC